MNLTRSMKYVFQKKGQTLLTTFLKDDLKQILAGYFGDIIVSRRSGKPHQERKTLSELKTSLQDNVLLLKILPQRIHQGLRLFMMGFLHELERLPDQRERTVYCMKVIAALSKFAFSSAYEVGLSGGPKLLVFGKGGRSMYSSLVLSKFLYRSIQAFLIRFIEEVEKEIDDPQELKNLQSFKDIILDDKGNAVDKLFDGLADPKDPAFNLVESFKNYIFTGELLDR